MPNLTADEPVNALTVKFCDFTFYPYCALSNMEEQPQTHAMCHERHLTGIALSQHLSSFIGVTHQLAPSVHDSPVWYISDCFHWYICCKCMAAPSTEY